MRTRIHYHFRFYVQNMKPDSSTKYIKKMSGPPREVTLQNTSGANCPLQSPPPWLSNTRHPRGGSVERAYPRKDMSTWRTLRWNNKDAHCRGAAKIIFVRVSDTIDPELHMVPHHLDLQDVLEPHRSNAQGMSSISNHMGVNMSRANFYQLV